MVMLAFPRHPPCLGTVRRSSPVESRSTIPRLRFLVDVVDVDCCPCRATVRDLFIARLADLRARQLDLGGTGDQIVDADVISCARDSGYNVLCDIHALILPTAEGEPSRGAWTMVDHERIFTRPCMPHLIFPYYYLVYLHTPLCHSPPPSSPLLLRMIRVAVDHRSPEN